MREWVELFDEPRPSFEVLAVGFPDGHLSVYRVAGLVLARYIYVHCELEVHTVYQRLFKKAGKGLHPRGGGGGGGVGQGPNRT